jgi:hypothetical protein
LKQNRNSHKIPELETLRASVVPLQDAYGLLSTRSLRIPLKAT